MALNDDNQPSPKILLDPLLHPGKQVKRDAADVTKRATESIPGVQGITAAFTSPNTWLRVAEVGVGLALVVLGLAYLMRGELTTAAKIAAAVK